MPDAIQHRAFEVHDGSGKLPNALVDAQGGFRGLRVSREVSVASIAEGLELSVVAGVAG